MIRSGCDAERSNGCEEGVERGSEVDVSVAERILGGRVMLSVSSSSVEEGTAGLDRERTRSSACREAVTTLLYGMQGKVNIGDD